MTLGVGVIGFGVMGRTHAAAYQWARNQGLPVELRGICSRRVQLDGHGRTGNLEAMAAGEQPLELARVRAYADHGALLENPEIHAVSITTYTDTHVPIALDALAAGKHVLVEKPVALTSAEVERLAAAVPEGLTCMPAFCMRFWPGWPWLRDRIHDRAFGALRSLQLLRLGEPPDWAPEFYGDPARSGGALFDLHIHDVDFVRWCLGEPADLSATGSRSHVTTRYRYPDGPPVVTAEGGHLARPGYGFQMRYRAEFDEAVVDFQHDRDPPVRLTRGGRVEAVELPAATAYELQARHFIEQVLGTVAEPLRATMADALAVTRLLEWEAGELENEG